MNVTSDPNRQVDYPLRWPAWLRDQVTAAVQKEAREAAAKGLPPPSIASWLRQAAIAKLQNDEEEAAR